MDHNEAAAKILNLTTRINIIGYRYPKHNTYYTTEHLEEQVVAILQEFLDSPHDETRPLAVEPYSPIRETKKMDKLKTVLIAFGGLFAALAIGALVLIVMWMSYSNNEIRLRNAIAAQQKSNESSFDKTWKVIQQQAGVATTERESFRQVYTEIMTATRGVAGNWRVSSHRQRLTSAQPCLLS